MRALFLLLLIGACSTKSLDLGGNDDGGIGDDDDDDVDASVDADRPDGGAARRVLSLSLGAHHGCGRWDDGDFACWGGSKFGQASDAFESEGMLCDQCVMPRHEFNETEVAAIAAGGDHTCFVRGDHVACFGRNDFGQLGRDIADANRHPEIRELALEGVTTVVAGHAHTCVLAGDHVYCFGLGDRYQLGVDPTSLDTCEVPAALAGSDGLPEGGEVPCSLSPLQVPGLSGVRTIFGGPHTTCAKTDAEVLCFGDGAPLPMATTPLAPTAIAPFASARSVALGFDHGCLVDAVGATRCFGAHTQGQLGLGESIPTSADCDDTRCHEPVPIQTLDPALDVVAGDRFSCARLESHAVYCWGVASDGRLGISSFSDLPDCGGEPCARVPSAVFDLGDALILESGDRFSCALREAHDGLVVCWGENDQAQVAPYRREDSRFVPAPFDFGF